MTGALRRFTLPVVLLAAAPLSAQENGPAVGLAYRMDL